MHTHAQKYINMYYTALQNVPKSLVDSNGPPQRSQVCNFLIFNTAKSKWPLSLATGFGLLFHIFHIIPQEVRSFNVAESHCNLKSASNGLLRNNWNFKVLLA